MRQKLGISTMVYGSWISMAKNNPASSRILPKLLLHIRMSSEYSLFQAQISTALIYQYECLALLGSVWHLLWLPSAFGKSLLSNLSPPRTSMFLGLFNKYSPSYIDCQGFCQNFMDFLYGTRYLDYNKWKVGDSHAS